MIRLALAIAGLLFVCCAAQAETYEEMVARVRAGDAAVDYRALRDAYAASPQYSPYGGSDDARKAMRDGFVAGECAKVLQAAEIVLTANFVDVQAHMLSATCRERGGDQRSAALHKAVAKGLLDSIVASGDGKSTKTAFVVISVDEEYVVLSSLGWHMTQQSLINDDGHAFDAMQATSRTGENATFYFQIDRLMAWLSHSMER